MSEITVDAVKKFNITELKWRLSKHRLSVNGKKDELLKKLTQAIWEIYSERTDNIQVNEANRRLNMGNVTGLMKKILKEEFTRPEEKLLKQYMYNFCPIPPLPITCLNRLWMSISSIKMEKLAQKSENMYISLVFKRNFVGTKCPVAPTLYTTDVH